MPRTRKRWDDWKKTNRKKVLGIKGAGFILRAVRTAVLGISIYQTGKAMGTSEYARDPRAMEKKIRNQLVMSQAFEADANGNPKFPRLLGTLHPSHRRVEGVGNRIIKGARKFVEAKIKSRADKLNDQAFPAEKRPKVQKELKFWSDKLKMIKGNWHFIVIDSPVPQAFVSDLSPRKIYVNTGLLTTLKCTDDELAMVLGHEISHLLHGHTEARYRYQFELDMIQLLFLSMLDSTGVFTLLGTWMGWTWFDKQAYTYSRENETEADSTGLKICAAACYNTHMGPHVFAKIQKVSGISADKKTSSWNDSHPLPMDRERKLMEQSKMINCDHNPNCHGMIERIMMRRREKKEEHKHKHHQH